MSEEPEVPPTKSSPFLSRDQIEAALTYLTDAWPNHRMTNEQREAWQDVLCQLHPGELKAGLASGSFDRKFRPDPYPVLEVVLGLRAKAAREAKWAQDERDRLKRLSMKADPPGVGFIGYLRAKERNGFKLTSDQLHILETESSLVGGSNGE